MTSPGLNLYSLSPKQVHDRQEVRPVVLFLLRQHLIRERSAEPDLRARHRDAHRVRVAHVEVALRQQAEVGPDVLRIAGTDDFGNGRPLVAIHDGEALAGRAPQVEGHVEGVRVDPIADLVHRVEDRGVQHQLAGAADLRAGNLVEGMWSPSRRSARTWVRSFVDGRAVVELLVQMCAEFAESAAEGDLPRAELAITPAIGSKELLCGVAVTGWDGWG